MNRRSYSLPLAASTLACLIWLCFAGTAAAAGHSRPETVRPVATVLAETLSVPPYMPQAQQPLPTLDSAGLALLAAKFAVVLVLLVVTLRILRAVTPRLRSTGPGRLGGMILHSEALGDKQRACLIDLHGQLVLVAVSTAGVTHIATVENKETVTALRTRYGAVPVSGLRGKTADPSFATTLARELYEGDPVAQGDAWPSQVEQADERAVAADQQGDLRLGLALSSIRALRQKVDRS